MKEIFLVLAVSLLALFALPSCTESIGERVPKEPESKHSVTPWNQMQGFEQNAIFGPMNRRR